MLRKKLQYIEPSDGSMKKTLIRITKTQNYETKYCWTTTKASYKKSYKKNLASSPSHSLVYVTF